jgi:gluconate 2-dehydrogenase gamma chain
MSSKDGAFDRRSLLLGGATLVVGSSLAGCPPDAPKDDRGAGKGSQKPADKPNGPDGEMTLADVLPILVSVCDRLLPADDLGPGAKDAGVDTYLEQALADPRMKAIKSLATRGAVFLGKAAQHEHNKPFVELTEKQRDDYLLRFAKNEVRPNGFSPQAFVRVMLALTLEAFLGDPRRGGNRDQVGWKFVGGVDWAGRHG